MIQRTLLLAAALFGGVVASQAPEFAQQYRQRLGGAVDELGRVVADFDRDAATAGLDRQRALATMVGDDTKLVQLRGASMEASVERYERLSAQRSAFEASGPLGRIEAVLRAPDRELVDATWQSYEPAVPTTAAGAITAAIGFAIVYVIAACGHLATAPLRKRRRMKRAAQQRVTGTGTGNAIHERFRTIGGVELEQVPREPIRSPPRLED